MRIHTIGDSHSHYAWPESVTPHHLGAILCYSFGQEKLDRCDLRDFDIENGDTIIFCFGEIDCRAHIHKHITADRGYESIIDELVDNYFEAIELNITTSELELHKIGVFNVVPPNNGGTRNHDWSGISRAGNLRKRFVIYFNQRLAEKCQEYGYWFVDVYDKYTDVNGWLDTRLSDNHMHIGDGSHLKRYLEENLNSRTT